MPIEGVGARRARWAVAVFVLTAGTVSAAVVTSADATTGVALVEGPACDAPPPSIPPLPAATITAEGAAAPMVLFIPPTVFVRVDGRGDPEHVTTNTGCAPRRADRFLVEIHGGPDAVGAPSGLVDAVMALPFGGDWRETGRWHEV
jgi:hypothetical protein